MSNLSAFLVYMLIAYTLYTLIVYKKQRLLFKMMREERENYMVYKECAVVLPNGRKVHGEVYGDLKHEVFKPESDECSLRVFLAPEIEMDEEEKDQPISIDELHETTVGQFVFDYVVLNGKLVIEDE